MPNANGEFKFNKDADLILEKARKVSLGWSFPGPALCEELIFIAFAALQHPLYVSLTKRFSLSTNVITNTLHRALIQSKKDAPTEQNKAYEMALLNLMWEEAQQKPALTQMQDARSLVLNFSAGLGLQSQSARLRPTSKLLPQKILKL